MAIALEQDWPWVARIAVFVIVLDGTEPSDLMSIITLTTDYGERDHYVGAVKGVVLGIAPDVRLVDITHEIDPHDVSRGAFVLRQVWSWYPPGTVHLGVIDPGVGTDRRIILAEYGGRHAVVPDNGLITLVHHDFPLTAVHVVENADYFLAHVSGTFHGRDIMAPVAAHLAKGVESRDFGPSIDQVELLPLTPRAEATAAGYRGSVICVDRFGTLVTNIREDQLTSSGQQFGTWNVVVNGNCLGPIHFTFSDVAPGDPVALIGGSGLLEIAVNRGRAVERFGPAESVSIEVQSAGRTDASRA